MIINRIPDTRSSLICTVEAVNVLCILRNVDDSRFIGESPDNPAVLVVRGSSVSISYICMSVCYYLIILEMRTLVTCIKDIFIPLMNASDRR